MAPRDIQSFYYSKTLPARAVAIAQVTARQATPADLIDVVNTPYRAGSLGVWKASQGIAARPDFTAPGINQSILLTGDISFLVENQFFQITNRFAPDGTALYFYHNFGQQVTGAKVLNLDGSALSPAPAVLFSGQSMYHDVPVGVPCQVRYIDIAGRVQIRLLHYNQTLPLSPVGDTTSGYAFVGGVIELAHGAQTYALRFTAPNGYTVLPPYGAPSYLPWFPRVRFSIQPPVIEYPVQNFLPVRPYMLGYWVPGAVLGPNLIQFERQKAYYDPDHLPDILVFDRDGDFKYAMDGSGNGEPSTHGTLYNWKRRQIVDLDPFTARAQVVPVLDPTDSVYGFYSYVEPDVVYTSLDVNPVTHPAMKNTVAVFYYRAGVSAQHEIFHQVFNDAGPIAGLTNDPAPPVWTAQVPSAGTVFAAMVVGVSFGAATFDVQDVRVRGGGLTKAAETIPQADHFWDLGYLDGRPYPVGGALVVYLPARILDTLTRDVIAGKIEALLPMGVLPVLRFYDPAGEETV